MKALLLYADHNIQIEEIDKPSPGPGEVLLKVEAVGICGSDVHFFKEGHIGSMRFKGPHVLGHEFAGTVVELGPGVEGLEVGDHVAANPMISCGVCEPCREGKPNLCLNPRFVGTPPWPGAMQEYFVHPASYCVKLPANVSPIAGALLEPLAVAIHSVDLAELKPAHTAAVIGCGPIGLLLLQLSRLSGATDVYAAEISPMRLEAATRFGATVVFNAREVDVVEETLKATGGRGVDVSFEAAGVRGSLEQGVEITRPGGKIIVLGTPGHPVSAEPIHLRHKELTLIWARRYLYRDYSRALTLVAEGIVNIERLVTHRFSLENAVEGFEALARGDGIIKSVIEM